MCSSFQPCRDNGTVELDPMLWRLITYNGRDYQEESLNKEISLVPVDDVRLHQSALGRDINVAQEEIDRLFEQHEILKMVFHDRVDRLFLAPVTNLTRVLDCGHGSAAWAVEVAELYPECQVWRRTYRGRTASC